MKEIAYDREVIRFMGSTRLGPEFIRRRRNPVRERTPAPPDLGGAPHNPPL